MTNHKKEFQRWGRIMWARISRQVLGEACALRCAQKEENNLGSQDGSLGER
jgi:hypothetical protein